MGRKRKRGPKHAHQAPHARAFMEAPDEAPTGRGAFYARLHEEAAAGRAESRAKARDRAAAGQAARAVGFSNGVNVALVALHRAVMALLEQRAAHEASPEGKRERAAKAMALAQSRQRQHMRTGGVAWRVDSAGRVRRAALSGAKEHRKARWQRLGGGRWLYGEHWQLVQLDTDRGAHGGAHELRYYCEFGPDRDAYGAFIGHTFTAEFAPEVYLRQAVAWLAKHGEKPEAWPVFQAQGTRGAEFAHGAKNNVEKD